MSRQTIQWFPGHMHKARKEIEEIIPKIDVIIEVLDARIPFSSENPLICSLRGEKPVVKVLNKRDLADPKMTANWIAHLEKEQQVSAIAINSQNTNEVNQITESCRNLVSKDGKVGQDILAMVMGIPNVGKSTIINTLAGRTIAITGNQPAVTRQQQRINLKNGIILLDTPGILWPKVSNPHSGFRLAATGAIRDTAMEYIDVALFTLEYLVQTYPQSIKDRYGISLDQCKTEVELLEDIGRSRGCLRKGGIDLHKASEILINELRRGILGKITMERPEMITQELIDATLENERKIEEKSVKKQQRRKRYLRNKR